MRIYELAKELNINSKELVKIIKKEFGIELKSHMSSVTDLEALRIKKYFNTINNHSSKDNKSKKEFTEKSPNKTTEKKKAVINTEKKVDNKNNQVENRNKFKTNKKNNKISDKKVSSQNVNKGNKRSLEKHTKKSKKSYKKRESFDETVSSIEIDDSILVRDFAEKVKVPVNTVISKLISLGVMASLNQEIDFDTVSILAEEFNVEVSKKEAVDELKKIEDKLINMIDDSEEELFERPPIVTVMGHVDHGKTSLLDAIRDTNITDKEAGGITQHIGASIVSINNKKITFLDTPGHEAFTAMRARGAQITDIAILVVAVDDGVMPQTIEAINHAKAAKVPIIVAINKMDKPGSNPDRIKQELTDNGLIPEDWGGDTICVPVSAMNKMGIDELLEMILLVSEMQEIKANPNRPAKGTIIEAKLDKGRGPVATVLVEKGTLNKGNVVLAGSASGKIRAMIDSTGKRTISAGPSIPVEILGLSEVPEAGDHLFVLTDEKEAREISEKRKEKIREESIKPSSKVSLDDLFEQIQKGEVKDLNIIIKADVSGSIGAVKQSLEKLSIDEVKVKTIHEGVGGINETDIMLASASNAIVIGFNVRPTNSALELSKKEKVDVRTYRIIYNAIEDIEAAVKGMLEPEYKELVQGRCEVRATFKVPGVGIVAGIYVSNGKITRKSKVRLLRNNIVVHEGEISSLKRFKDDVSELNTGYEGGLGIDKYNDIKEGDVIEAYTIQEINR